MDEHEFINTLIAELRLASKSNWQQRGYKDDLFHIFRHSPKDERRFPSLSGDEVKDHIRNELGSSPEEYERIEKTVEEVCFAWDEWRYALEHWDHS